MRVLILILILSAIAFAQSSEVMLSFNSMQHGQYGLAVIWTFIPGSLVELELWRNGAYVAKISDSIYNPDGTDSYLYQGVVPISWGSGSRFQIRLTDSLGSSYWSDYFTIRSNAKVTEPQSSSQVSTTSGEIFARWEGLGGSLVGVNLCSTGGQANQSLGIVSNNGSSTLLLPEELDPQGTYFVQITDSYGNEANSDRFHINDICVTSPDSRSVWERGDLSPLISWRSGNDSDVWLRLQRNGSVVFDITEGWVTTTGDFRAELTIPETWSGGDNYQVEVRSRNAVGEISKGYSDFFTIPHSDNEIAGANTLGARLTSQGEISYPTDLDFWEFNISTDSLYILEVKTQDALVNCSITQRGGDRLLSTVSSREKLEIDPVRNGTCFLSITAHNSALTSYQIRLRSKIRPESLRPIGIAAGYETAFSVPGVAGAYISASYSPVRFAAVSVGWNYLYGTEPFGYIGPSTDMFNYVSVGASLISPEYSRVSLIGGANYKFVLSEPELFWMNDEYEDNEIMYQNGIKPFAGLRVKLAYEHFGNAWFLLALQEYVNGELGLTSIGIQRAF
ncbi:MAG: hypothetical protein KAR40_17910 [Candidatus Sabulitectum sp.]|nr:hypothetical protein [Candidatus Sabulitectum sp.]